MYRNFLDSKRPDMSNFFYPIQLSHGTTTLAFICSSGILIAVDSRSSMGKYIGSNKVKKVIEINSFFLGTMAGGAADCFFWERNLGCLCDLYEMQNNQHVSISGASKLLANMIYVHKNSGLSIGAIIAGWDHNGPEIYFIDSEGSRFRINIVSVGSGSTYAYGILDTDYKWNISIETACNIGKRSIFQSSYKDPFSGGSVNLYFIRKDGWIRISSDVINLDMFKKYNKKNNSIYI
ncbi:26S proteasome SU B5 (nucleomorph) [Cryptomonas paramecium]|uniref:Proteasome subunit beta n=1 Tax=Cryptomonas paramaecium TaxID=2898 RepID=F2HHU1_9CRYP|nr:26S proteasome SU B5 [Cryptomonas paramecium]AEA38887.1 26S proteasome SU B5 [Cryptomonas paramecium]|mmetsp:Transcript_88799/g.236392  ORF Transcript_88799/g.236392 Transcript_88799/m.236392 type:complete len:235 (-) Transcript_88799:3566-4270(-)